MKYFFLSGWESEPSPERLNQTKAVNCIHPKCTDPAGNLFPKNFGFRNLSKVKKDYARESLGRMGIRNWYVFFTILSHTGHTGWWWLEHGFYDFPFHLWDVILPIDELHHFSGGGEKPPTSVDRSLGDFWETSEISSCGIPMMLPRAEKRFYFALGFLQFAGSFMFFLLFRGVLWNLLLLPSLVHWNHLCRDKSRCWLRKSLLLVHENPNSWFWYQFLKLTTCLILWTS